MSSPRQEAVELGGSAAYWQSVDQERRNEEQMQQHHMQQCNLEKERKWPKERINSWLLNGACLANIVVFIVGLFLADWMMADLEDNPLVGFDADGLILIGGTGSKKMSQDYQYWRLGSSMFVNAGVVSVWFNVGTVYTYGMFIGSYLSPWALAFVYVTSGLVQIVVSANIGSDRITAGASGPAVGMLGGSLAVWLLHHRRFRNHLLTAAMMGMSLGLAFLIGATPFIDNSGNTIALVAGFMVTAGFLLVDKNAMSSRFGEFTLLAISCVSISLVLCVIIIGIIGLNVDTPVAGCCDDWVCTPSNVWNCDASKSEPSSSCVFLDFKDGSKLLQCTRGATFNVGVVTPDSLTSLCNTLCLSMEELVVDSYGDNDVK